MTFNHQNPYPNMEIVHYGDSSAYAFRNESSDKLIITIEGSGWWSVLGIKGSKRWKIVQTGSQLIQVLQDTHTVLIPEKLNRQPGLGYITDMNDHSNYTAEKLLACYTESINGYLAEHTYTSIVLIGISEGALLLPLIYEKMEDKDHVTGMVSILYGGLSLYESCKILSTSNTVLHKYSKRVHRSLVEIYSQDSTAYPDSIELGYFGMSLRWWSSFINIRPFDYYKNINIPVLFVHGKKDYRVSVESTQYIQENLPEKPFKYRYYPWGHGPSNYFEKIQFRNDIANWIIKNDL
jgi:esterase/lipase